MLSMNYIFVFYDSLFFLNYIERFLTTNFRIDIFNSPIIEISFLFSNVIVTNLLVYYFFNLEFEREQKEKVIHNKYEYLYIKFRNAFFSSNKTRQLLI